MRRLVTLLVLLGLQVAPGAQTPQRRPAQSDGVVRLLADLESALTSLDAEEFRRLVSPDLPAADALRFRVARGNTLPDSAILRERARLATDTGVDLLAEVLVSHGRTGRIATWQLSMQPGADDTDRYVLTGLNELAAIGDLLRLELDPTTQFAVNDLRISAPDMALTMTSGSAFVAESATGVTALVLRGAGQVHFSPHDPAEQGQLQIFGGTPALTTSIDSAYIRLNAEDFALRLSDANLTPVVVDPRELRRAQNIFDAMSPRTFNLDFHDLTSEQWSIEPAYGNVMIEFRSKRHGWLTYALTPGDAEDIVVFDRDGGHNLSSYSSTEAVAARGSRFYDEDAGVAYDILRHGLDLTFDPDRAWISGRSTLRLRVKRAGLNSLTLRLAAPLEVTSVTSVAFGRLLALRVSGQNNLLVGLPSPMPQGAELVLNIVYSGRLEAQGLNREAIDADLEPLQQSGFQEEPKILQTPEARFLYSNRALWYPQGPVSDYATATMRLTVPSEYQIVASGSPQGSSVSTIETMDGQRAMRTVRYVSDRPSRYLSCLISRFVPVARRQVSVPRLAPAEVTSETGPGTETVVEIEALATPRMAGRNQSLPDRLVDIIGFYARTVGEAPYPDFTLAAVDDNLPGGHSPAFFAILVQQLPSTPFRWSQDPVWFANYSRLFLAHEVAHQWWGQAVGWKNYHEQWLSEGFAQYFAVLYAGEDRGNDMVRSLLSRMRASTEEYAEAGPIYLGYRLGHIEDQARQYRAVTYNKSAIVLHLLRGLIGDEAFFGGIRKFYQDYRFRKAGTADLQRVMEEQSGQSLTRFFERWVLGNGLPEARLQTTITPDRRSAVIRVEQTGPVFDFAVFVTVEYANGESDDITVPVTEALVEHRLDTDREIRRVTTHDELIPGDIKG